MPPVCSCGLATCSRTHWVRVIGALNVPSRVALSRVSARHTFVKHRVGGGDSEAEEPMQRTAAATRASGHQLLSTKAASPHLDTQTAL